MKSAQHTQNENGGMFDKNEGSERSEAMHMASSSTSDLGSNSTKIHSASASSNANGGFGQTNDYMRSILMHPMCFPLVIYLNDIPESDDPNLPKYIWRALKGFNSSTSICTDATRTWRDNVFADTVREWNGGETDLTEKLLHNIKNFKMKNSPVETDGEQCIVGNPEEKGRVDLIFHEKGNSNSAQKVVALFEFGIENEMWWTKQDQILKYVKMLRTGASNKYKIDQPMLLSVITIKNKTTIGNENKKSRKDKLKDESRSSSCEMAVADKRDIDNICCEAQFGLFLCIPKGNDEFRIALLWRHSSTMLKDASTQFGKLVYAIHLCSYLNKPSNLKGDEIGYKYLGPNCCKIGESVSYTHTV